MTDNADIVEAAVKAGVAAAMEAVNHTACTMRDLALVHAAAYGAALSVLDEQEKRRIWDAVQGASR